MSNLRVVGAGVGRTGTHSLKLALEQLLGGPCHHMVEVLGNPSQVPTWIDAIEGRPVDWDALLSGYCALVDWPGASFWPELAAANPDALVLLSVRDPHAWYKSASNTIFAAFEHLPPEAQPWMTKLRQLIHDRFSDDFTNEGVMVEAFEQHNQAVRSGVPPERLLKWNPADGWDPICERLGLPIPSEPFPFVNTTDDFRAMLGMPPVAV